MLDIPWLCIDVIGAILSPPEFLVEKVESKGGLVGISSLEHTFRNKRVHEILRILQKLQLCFPVSEGREYLFPALLKASDARPDGIWVASSVLTRYFGKRLLCRTELDIFSPGFMPRFQVG